MFWRFAVAVGKNTFPVKPFPLGFQGAILMKKILVTVVLGVAAAATAQAATQPARTTQPAQTTAPAQAQQPATQSSAPVIKDPAEYNAYVGAIQQKDPAAQISGLEAFLTQYP